jgi:hypothetical protein
MTQARLMEWQTRHICTFIGAQAQVDTDKYGGRNPLVDAAQELSIFAGATPGQRRELGLDDTSPEQQELDDMRGEVVARDWRDDPRLQKPVPADPGKGVEAANAAGSYDAFLQAFGAPPVLQAVPDLPPED